MSLVDRISQLPEALILRILSALPTAKDVVATMVLSKRWESLWKRVPILVYDDSYQNINIGKFSRFVDRSLNLHEAPVETLHFKLSQHSAAGDIGVWIAFAVKRRVRDMSIEIDCSSSTTPVTLPRSLYTGCIMLVALKLKSVTLMSASSLPSFPSLKTLSLSSVKYPGDEFVERLLSNCHVLKDLDVERCLHDNIIVFTVRVPSLKNVSLYEISEKVKDGRHGFVIDAPLLETFDIKDYTYWFVLIENSMPMIAKASVDVTYNQPGKILGYITSVKSLFLCLSTSKEVYPVGSIFNRLVHLTLCTCEAEWLNLLMHLLRDCPTLQALKLEQRHSLRAARPSPCWKEPSSVPKCVLSSLETLEWLKYEGAKEEKELATFILRNANCLKKATISSKSTDPNKKLEMIKELSSSPRRSPTCQLIFD